MVSSASLDIRSIRSPIGYRDYRRAVIVNNDDPRGVAALTVRSDAKCRWHELWVLHHSPTTELTPLPPVPPGFQVYITLTTEDVLLDVDKSTKFIWYYLMTYGLSFSIVAIALAIDPAAYTQADFGVWMEPTSLFYCTFVTPILIFVLVSGVGGLSTVIDCLNMLPRIIENY